MDLHNLTIKNFREGLLKGDFSALEITQAFFERVKSRDGEIGAYLNLFEDAAVKKASEIDAVLAGGGSLPPLAGVPMALKDNILIEGTRTTAASRILENYVAAYDATVIRKLKLAGAVILGKTNLDEFAMGSSTENSGFQITKNPHDTTRVPGGSSGGSAAAVAADMALAALGSDTGGSIRQPASFCGVVGFKPTYGAVSRHGLIAMASSLDQIGPIAKTVEDTVMVFDAIKGRDGFDSTSASDRPSITDYDLEDVRRLKIGLPKEYFSDGVHEEVLRGVFHAVEKLKNLGIGFREVSLPHTKYALSVYYIIMPAEVSANLARYDGIRYAPLRDANLPARNATHPPAAMQQLRAGSVAGGQMHANAANKSELLERYFKTRELFGAEVKRRILLGTFVLSSGYYDTYYGRAQKVRKLILEDFEKAFKEVDVILAPTAPTLPFKIGEKTEDPLQMYLSDVFTIPANLTGLPAISIPVVSGNNSGDLPVGFQLIGRRFREENILNIGRHYERI